MMILLRNYCAFYRLPHFIPTSTLSPLADILSQTKQHVDKFTHHRKCATSRKKRSQNYIYTQPKEIQIEKYAIHQSSRVLYIFPLIQLFIIRNRWWASLRIFVGMYGVLQNILYKMQRCNPRLEIKKITILLASP